MNVETLIETRLRTGERNDGFRLSLAIDGGGMRGIVSGAMLIALRDLGVADVFDEYVGVSAAAINLAHWGQGRSWDALAMYYDFLPDNFFRNYRRSMIRPLLRMEYLDRLFTVDFPVSTGRIREVSARPTITFAADINAREIKTFDLTDDSIDPVSALKAGSWLPLLSGPPMEWDGARFVDGGILAAHPLYVAIERGATHVLALSPARDVGDSISARRTRPVLAKLLDGWSPGLGTKYRNSRRTWDRDRLVLDNADGVGQLNSSSVLRITPSADSHSVTRLTRDLGSLLEGARAGYSAIINRFADEPTTIPSPFCLGCTRQKESQE